MKLLISATPGVRDYKDVIAAKVCNSKNRGCMLHRWASYPGNTAFSEQIKMTKFTEADMTEGDVVTFKQWDRIERGCTLITRTVNVAAFVKELTRQTYYASLHSQISSRLPFLMQSNIGSRYSYSPPGFSRKLFLHCAGFSSRSPLGQQQGHPPSFCCLLHSWIQTEVLVHLLISDSLRHDSATMQTFIAVALRLNLNSNI